MRFTRQGRAGLSQESMFLRPGTLDEALGALAHTHGTIFSDGSDPFPALSGGLTKDQVNGEDGLR